MPAYAGPSSSRSLRTFRSTAPSHDAITMVASALPRTLTATKPEDIKRCTPRMIPTAATGTVPVAANVDTSTTIAEPATPAPPLDVTQDSQQTKLLSQRKIEADRLREKDGRGGEIQTGAVMIEGVAGREHEADNRLLATEAGELVNELGEYRYRRAGSDHDQQFGSDVAGQTPESDAVPVGDRPEN